MAPWGYIRTQSFEDINNIEALFLAKYDGSEGKANWTGIAAIVAWLVYGEYLVIIAQGIE